MCYPCSKCNRCGKMDRLRAIELQCPRCKEPWTDDDFECAACGYKRPKPPEAWAGKAGS